jgi:bifunctional DNA-binding transcriptional regulator/antitoxin component of YhaV-PrlF toxin-antitoxin module
MVLVYKSQVVHANTTSRSLRTTIPVNIVNELGIAKGDALDWSIKSIGPRKVAIIRKLE